MGEYRVKIIRNLLEDMLNPDKIKEWNRFYYPSIVFHGPNSCSLTKYDLEAAKEFNLRLCELLDKDEVLIPLLFEKEDKVVASWTLRAIDRIKKNLITVSGNTIYRFSEEKIAECWQSWDRLGMLEQMGEIKAGSSFIHLHQNSTGATQLGMQKYIQQASNLSNREKQCLYCVLKGKTAKETALLLSLSHRTVEYYLENVKGKLNCQNKRELFTMAQTLQRLELL